MNKKRSMRAAINDKCRDCIVDPLAGGTWRKQVEECTQPDCPLYEYRPMVTRRSTAKGPIPEGLRRYYEQKSCSKDE